MIEEPYRWLEAIENRREYVREQIKEGSPAFAACLDEGILLLGVGSGSSKVFEVFDRHALVGLGHPADIERLRHTAIDTVHLEAFLRAPEDVSLRRLVSFGLSPQLKTSFEQIFGSPFLAELLLAEVGTTPEKDLLTRLHFDGGFEIQSGGVAALASRREAEEPALRWLTGVLPPGTGRRETAEAMLQAWACLTGPRPFEEAIESVENRCAWREQIQGKTVEIGWLARTSKRPGRYESLTLPQLDL